MSPPVSLRLSRNEWCALIATTVVFALAVLTFDRTGLLTHAHGKMLWQGRVVEKWLFVLVGAAIFLPMMYGFQELLSRVWPDKEAGVRAGLLSDWDDDDLFHNGPPDLNAESTASDYLDYWISHKPTTMKALAEMGLATTPQYHEVLQEQRRQVEEWLKEAPEQKLRDILPTCRALPVEQDAHLAFRLCLACQLRGVPSREELAAYAQETGFGELTTMLASEV